MWFSKFLLAAYLMASVSVNITLAQNSPQDYVNAHNAVRAEVGVGPITWNNTVAAYAQKYANSRVENCELEHSGGPYGENIAEGYGNLNGVDAVKMWASEKPFYSHDTNSCVGDECLHYTQVVWRKSVHLGCGRAKCKNGWCILGNNLIEKTCKQTPYYDLCVRSLISSPRSFNTDVEGLAKIMVHTINAEATHTLHRIYKLLQHKQDTNMKRALQMFSFNIPRAYHKDRLGQSIITTPIHVLGNRK
ncbi:hypothetical protein Peur_036328 [Populus x canadensis]